MIHHFAWVDELAKFRYIQETWDQLMFGLRLGVHPQVLATTTPQPKALIKKLVADPDTHVTRGSTLDNHNHRDDLQKIKIAPIEASNTDMTPASMNATSVPPITVLPSCGWC